MTALPIQQERVRMAYAMAITGKSASCLQANPKVKERIMDTNDETVTFQCPVCGLEILADETPCDLEYGTKCGAEIIREGLGND